MPQENTAVSLVGENMNKKSLQWNEEIDKRCEQRFQEILDNELSEQIEAVEKSVQLSDEDYSIRINARD